MRRPDLKPQLDALPARPGVYQFLGTDDEVLYVGKAVNLRNRVRSYFHDSATHPEKTVRLIAELERIDWMVTQSDLEALLLEMQQIKAHRPHYNVLLKDDKRYPFIKVTWADAFPTVVATRRVVQDGSRYYGPYISAAAMHETLHALRKAFPYLDCNRKITGEDDRSCLYYHLDLCLAPCIGAVSEDDYREMIAGLCRFLKGDSGSVIAELREQMEAHAKNLEFEQAARLRDRISSIEHVIAHQRLIAPGLADQDVVAVARDNGSAVVQVFFVRNGRLLGREYFRLEGTSEEPDVSLLTSFVKQFYDEAVMIPGEIVLPIEPDEADVLEQWLADKRGSRVRILVPKRGNKKRMMDAAIENAGDTLRALKTANALQEEPDVSEQALTELQETLALPRRPNRIEGYDISNLRGTHTVGSMVVFEGAAPLKAHYRHFRVKTTGQGDDYAAMEEVLARRFRRLERHRRGESTDSPGDAGPFEVTPDLIVVDGGKGQLGVALRVLQSLGLDDIPAAALAKQNEEIFKPTEAEPVLLPKDSQALYLVQRLRDEAHRVAVSYSRQLRRRSGLRSSLDAIPGIGPKRRKALLNHFGSVERIREATVEEMAAVPSMTRKAAEQVKAFL